jgi:hypothetical protein
MPKYKVVEERLVTVEYEIEADSKENAESLDGEILDEYEIDNIGYELKSCEEI